MQATENTITVSKNELKALLACASKDITRAHLCGVAIEFTREKAHLISTDGHRLMFASCERKVGASDNRETVKPVVIPRDKVEAALRLCTRKSHEVRINVDTESETVALRGFEIEYEGHPGSLLGSVLFDYSESFLQFPPWRQVVPTDEPEGQAKTALDFDTEGKPEGGATRKVGFNPAYMDALVLLAKIGNKWDGIECCPGATDLDPILFRRVNLDGVAWAYVLMPMRLGESIAVMPSRTVDDETLHTHTSQVA